ncbi:hypothetical protein D3C87_1758320 [compost metagenome]
MLLADAGAADGAWPGCCGFCGTPDPPLCGLASDCLGFKLELIAKSAMPKVPSS